MTGKVTIHEAVKILIDSCKERNAGDPFAAGRIREIILADLLGHNIAADLHGHDAIVKVNQNNFKVEYKTAFIEYGLKGRYDVSWYPTWEEQEKYLLTEKIGSSKYHYFATFDSSYVIQEVMELTGERVCDLLIPAFKSVYLSKDSRQDKRNSGLYASLGSPDIRAYGKLVYEVPVAGLHQWLEE